MAAERWSNFPKSPVWKGAPSQPKRSSSLSNGGSKTVKSSASLSPPVSCRLSWIAWKGTGLESRTAISYRSQWGQKEGRYELTPHWHIFIFGCGISDRYSIHAADGGAGYAPGEDQAAAQHRRQTWGSDSIGSTEPSQDFDL